MHIPRALYHFLPLFTPYASPLTPHPSLHFPRQRWRRAYYLSRLILQIR
jgi:hypothetical protein